MEAEETRANEWTEQDASEITQTKDQAHLPANGAEEAAQEADFCPEGEVLFETDVHIDAAALFDYFLRHTYTSLSGLFSTVIGVLMVTLYFVRDAHVLYLIFGVIVIFYLPWNLYLNARRQALSDNFKTPLHYAFYENGVVVSREDTRQMQRWEDMVKAVSTRRSIIIYTGQNAASIFPRRDLGEHAEGLIRVVFAHMDAKKVKIRY